MSSLTRLIFFSSIASLGSMPPVFAKNPDRRAKAEFEYLKHTADYQNAIANKSYYEVEGTSFIGLKAAWNEARTCLFGFVQAHTDSHLTQKANTRFVCFNTERYRLVLRMDWCEAGAVGCEIDPAGISIGIGNLDVVEPTLIDVPAEQAPSFFNNFPQSISFEFHPADVSLMMALTPGI